MSVIPSREAMMKTGMTETIGGNMIVDKIQFAAERFAGKRSRASE